MPLPAHSPSREDASGVGPTIYEPLGLLGGLEIGVEAVDAVTASADLAVCGLFTHEAAAASLTGGMLHLDTALRRAATRLRAEGVFTGAAHEALLVRRPPAPILSGAVLIVGLGAPEAFMPRILARGTRRAFDTATLLGARSVIFAPSILDGGVRPGPGDDLALAMIEGLVEGLRAADSLVARSLSPASTVARFGFAAGPSHLVAAAEAFRRAILAADLD